VRLSATLRPLSLATRRAGKDPSGFPMQELLRTNDLVLISFADSLLREAGIDLMIVDQNMSVIEGSLGILPRRVLVPDDRIAEARTLLEGAGIGAELVKPKKGA
jgi:hypothetical protein